MIINNYKHKKIIVIGSSFKNNLKLKNIINEILHVANCSAHFYLNYESSVIFFCFMFCSPEDGRPA